MKDFILHLVSFLLLSATAAGQTVFVIKVDGTINPASADFIHDQIELASAKGAECLVIQLNTPGGLLKSTRAIVTDILNAPLPVIVYVSPSGSQAASAGVFVTLAGHLASMAPGTNIGAAHPVSMGEQQDSVMMSKVTNDAAAFIRSISEKRKRNVAWAEEAVRKSVSITEGEAVLQHVIDFIATDVQHLLDSADGRIVSIGEEPRTINTKNAQIVVVESSFRQRLLDLLSDPNIAYILMMLGFYGLMFELYNPGAIFPGVVGVICLILAFYSFHTLPINYAGLALIVVAIILFILEIKIISHGLLTIGGVVALALGSTMLLRHETSWDFVTISWEVIAGVVVSTTAFFLLAIGMGVRAQRLSPTTGSQGMVGEVGTALTDLIPDGQVKVHGEIWKAESASGTIPQGTRIRVHRIENLKLIVVKT